MEFGLHLFANANSSSDFTCSQPQCGYKIVQPPTNRPRDRLTPESVEPEGPNAARKPIVDKDAATAQLTNLWRAARSWRSRASSSHSGLEWYAWTGSATIW